MAHREKRDEGQTFFLIGIHSMQDWKATKRQKQKKHKD